MNLFPRKHPVCSMLLLAGLMMFSLPHSGWAQYAEVQAYPAGVILSGGIDIGPIGVHAGYNHTRRGDFGRHDDERGNGFGAGATWWYGSPLRLAGLRAGVRLDVWQLDIDWKDAGFRTGSTEIVVLQPTVRAAWHVPATPLSVTAAVGVELNIRTDGEEVGEGPIGLIGLRWSVR